MLKSLTTGLLLACALAAPGCDNAADTSQSAATAPAPAAPTIVPASNATLPPRNLLGLWYASPRSAGDGGSTSQLQPQAGDMPEDWRLEVRPDGITRHTGSAAHDEFRLSGWKDDQAGVISASGEHVRVEGGLRRSLGQTVFRMRLTGDELQISASAPDQPPAWSSDAVYARER